MNVRTRNRIGAITLLLALAMLAFAQSQDFRNTQPVAKANTKPEALAICEVGIIDEILVPAEEMGVLDSLNVKEGEMVERGAVLGTIDKTDAELAVAVAQANYDAAKKTSENELSIKAAYKAYLVSKSEYVASDRANEIKEGTVPAMQIQRTKLQMDRSLMQRDLAVEELFIAKLDARAKKEELARANASLNRREIKSRINGVVVKLEKHAGEWVQPGETVMRIVRMDRLRVEGRVNGTIHARHEILDREVNIQVNLTGGGVENVRGKIVFADPLVDLNQYTVRAEIDNRKIRGRWLITPGLEATMELASGLGF